MKNAFVCILDLLGTKGHWNEGNAEQYFTSIEKVLDALKAAKEFAATLDFPATFDFISFSDTLIIIWESDQEDEYFFEKTVQGFSQTILGVFQIYFAQSLIPRGAIAYGPLMRRGNHFIGAAVEDAAEYFEAQELAGICFTPQTTLRMHYATMWQRKYFQNAADQFVLLYPTPLKNGSVIELYQINWLKNALQNDAERMHGSVTGRMTIFLCNRPVPLNAVQKIENTLSFMRFAEKNYKT